MSRRTLPGELRARLGLLVSQAEKQVRLPSPSQMEADRAPRIRYKPSGQKTQAESFKDLDHWLEEAQAGMPDDSLARAANVSMTAVLEWRKARGVKRKRGWQARREADVWAMDAFGDGFISEIQQAQSQLKGAWDLPEYVLRLPLKYDSLCRAAYHLAADLGMTPDEIAGAIGLRIRDVEMAIAVETAYLTRVSISCSNCGRPCDPNYGEFCSTRCKAEKT